MGPRHTARLVTVSFALRGSRVLLRRHAEGGDRFSGRWNGVGGHVEPGEDVRAAARRELREETGLAVDLALRGVVHESGLLGAHHVLFVFVGDATHGNLCPEEGIELAWHPLDGLDALPLVHDVPQLIERALGAREVFFATERYDGGDRCIALRFDGDPDRTEAAHAR